MKPSTVKRLQELGLYRKIPPTEAWYRWSRRGMLLAGPVMLLFGVLMLLSPIKGNIPLAAAFFVLAVVCPLSVIGFRERYERTRRALGAEDQGDGQASTNNRS